MGIDPGLSRLGYGIVTRTNHGYRATAAGILTTSLEIDLPCRLAIMSADLRALFEDFRPSVVVVERVFFQVNAKTAMSVGQASGLALATAAANGIEVHQFTPNEVKLAVAGNGAASKSEVATMVGKLLGVDQLPKQPDAIDALALAICYLGSAKLQGAIKSALAKPPTPRSWSTQETARDKVDLGDRS